MRRFFEYVFGSINHTYLVCYVISEEEGILRYVSLVTCAKKRINSKQKFKNLMLHIQDREDSGNVTIKNLVYVGKERVWPWQNSK